MSIIISESTRTALERALRCDYSAKKTDIFKACLKQCASSYFNGKLNNT